MVSFQQVFAMWKTLHFFPHSTSVSLADSLRSAERPVGGSDSPLGCHSLPPTALCLPREELSMGRAVPGPYGELPHLLASLLEGGAPKGRRECSKMVCTLPQAPPYGGASPLCEGAKGLGGILWGLPRRLRRLAMT